LEEISPSMRIKIIVAPQTNPDPYWKPLQPLGVATITAFLRSKGYHVDQDDLDIKAIVAERELESRYHKVDMQPFRQTDRVKEYLLQRKQFPYLETMIIRLLSWTDYQNYDVVAISMATRAHQLITPLENFGCMI